MYGNKAVSSEKTLDLSNFRPSLYRLIIAAKKARISIPGTIIAGAHHGDILTIL